MVPVSVGLEEDQFLICYPFLKKIHGEYRIRSQDILACAGSVEQIVWVV